MLLVSHTAIGLAVGLFVPNPVAAFGVGVASHHIADAIPHFDPGTYLADRPRAPLQPKDYRLRDWIFVGLDGLLTLVLLIGLFFYLPTDRWTSIAAGILGANFPDIVHNVPFWSPGLHRFGWIRIWQEKIHWKYHTTVPPRLWYLGAATQLVMIGLIIWFVISKNFQ